MNLDRIKSPDDPGFQVGVALLQMSLRDHHAAVAYRSGARMPLLLHLAFHENLRHEEFDGRYLCFSPAISRNGQMALAGFCRRVATSFRNRRIPYGLRYREADRFDPLTGDYMMGEDGTGLNCATFVLHLFKSARHPLIDTREWPARATEAERQIDVQRQTALVDILRTHEHHEQADKVQADIGCMRIRPEEVAGACLVDTLPAAAFQAIANGVIAIAEVTLRVNAG